MTEPHRAVIARMSADVAAISAYLNRMSNDLTELDRTLAHGTVLVPQYSPPTPYQAVPQQVPATAQPRSEGWIGRILAVAGVAVTLTGVVLLLVLAAQAGILRSEFRVGAGAVLATGLVGGAWLLHRRPGGQVGAIALAATGVAAAYLDVVALSRIYDWVSAPVGLVTAAAIGGGGLMLARRWNSEQLGLLVLVPLIGLAPVVTGGVTHLLVGFMLTLSAASLPVQYGKAWSRLHAARIAASTIPLLIALAAAAIAARDDLVLACACAVAALLALAGGLLLLRWSTNPSAVAVLTAAGMVPLLCVSAGIDRVVGALMVAALAAALLAVVAIGDQVCGVTRGVRRIWSALAAVAALIAVTTALDGAVAGPVLLAMAVVVAVGGRRDLVARWVAIGFAVVGGLLYLGYAPPHAVAYATELRPGIAVSVLIGSVLVISAALTITWSWAGRPAAEADTAAVVWALAAVVIGYAITMFTVTTGVLVGGTGGGFFGGHVAATICWVAVAAGLFAGAARRPKEQRSLPIRVGLVLVVAAMAKLFLFDLGTLDGIFRVVVFIVVGLVLLGMGAGYARLLAQQDEQDQHPAVR